MLPNPCLAGMLQVWRGLTSGEDDLLCAVNLLGSLTRYLADCRQRSTRRRCGSCPRTGSLCAAASLPCAIRPKAFFLAGFAGTALCP